MNKQLDIALGRAPLPRGRDRAEGVRMSTALTNALADVQQHIPTTSRATARGRAPLLRGRDRAEGVRMSMALTHALADVQQQITTHFYTL
jgi:hypothetical protein